MLDLPYRTAGIVEELSTLRNKPAFPEAEWSLNVVTKPLAPQDTKRKLYKSIAIAVALISLVAVFYAMTLIKLSKHTTLPHDMGT